MAPDFARGDRRLVPTFRRGEHRFRQIVGMTGIVEGEGTPSASLGAGRRAGGGGSLPRNNYGGLWNHPMPSRRPTFNTHLNATVTAAGTFEAMCSERRTGPEHPHRRDALPWP